MTKHPDEKPPAAPHQPKSAAPKHPASQAGHAKAPHIAAKPHPAAARQIEALPGDGAPKNEAADEAASEGAGSTDSAVGAPKEKAHASTPPIPTNVVGSGGKIRNKVIFGLVGVGIVLSLASAYFFARPPKPQPPLFKPAADPYAQGIFANGIIESYQAHGENINIYPEVPGTIREILVAEGESVKTGTPLLAIDDTVQKATTDQLKAQADAAAALLEELKAQPRKETLEVARAQVDLGAAALKSAQDTLDKQQHSFEIEPRSVSKDTLDTQRNAVKVARANLGVATRQLDLTKAGAWTYDVQNQERQVEALTKAWDASTALLAKYTVRAPTDGSILSIQAALGSYVSPQGAYDTYTQGFDPIVVMGSGKTGGYMNVRCYVDEILIPKLPPAEKMVATMSIRGTTTSIPLEFVRLQPYVTPKIELSDQRLEKVDLRVLPAIFRFRPPPGVDVYPGEMVDVYIGSQEAAKSAPAPLAGKQP